MKDSQEPSCLYSSLNLDEQLCFALHAAAGAISGVYMETLESRGLTYAQYLVLICLFESDGMSVHHLGKRLTLEPAALTPLLDRLEADARIVRRAGGKTGEVVEIWLTEDGRACQDIALEARQGVVDRLAMTDAEIGDLRRELMQITQKLRFPAPRAAAAGLPEADGAVGA